MACIPYNKDSPRAALSPIKKPGDLTTFRLVYSLFGHTNTLEFCQIIKTWRQKYPPNASTDSVLPVPAEP